MSTLFELDDFQETRRATYIARHFEKCTDCDYVSATVLGLWGIAHITDAKHMLTETHTHSELCEVTA